MASSSSSTPDPSPVEVPPWLKTLPLAPQYSPTLSDFSDPISFILKIEKEASTFGICKIIPPLPPPSKKSILSNLSPSFTTRQQQIGFCPRRPRPVQKPVWQSGESYTLPQFEAKAKQFEKTQMRKFARKTPFSALELEALFWKACADKPFSVEYANDVPGSGFGPAGRRRRRKWCREEEVGNVGESGWNMRGVSRAKGSLLRFMKEDIAGVTSPMVYVGMMFSWFAWHVEDHELHSLNYLHMGAGKTWYGVPRDAGPAFEEVVRVHGYGGEVNPLVTFTILGEKTTVMSPEVLIGAGIPCCRLVQNPGEFVVTFPGAYHSGFSHGFNCGEAANIATPEWLRVAKEAAIRRASINYPPMVSHFQLLYALALSICSRMPIGGLSEPRSSRLKDKMKGEGEMMVKEFFLQNVMETNELLSVLLDEGSSCIVLPQHSSSTTLCSNSRFRSQLKMRPRLSLGLCSREEALEASRNFPSSDVMLGENSAVEHLNSLCSAKRKSMSVCQNSVTSDKSDTRVSDIPHVENEKENPVRGDGLLDQGLLSCVTCGILSFTCVAVVHPSEGAARYLKSVDCDFLNYQNIGSGEISGSAKNTNMKSSSWDLVHGSGQLASHVLDRDDNKLAHNNEDGYDDEVHQGVSALALLASAYGDSSDSEEEPSISYNNARFSYNECSTDYHNMHSWINLKLEEGGELKSEFSDGRDPCMVDNLEDSGEMEIFCSSIKSMEVAIDDNSHRTVVEMGKMPSEQPDASYDCDPASVNGNTNKATSLGNFDNIRKDAMLSVAERYDKDSSRMHVFCLEHALEVERLLRPFGGVNIMLLCHPDYPKIAEEAKLLAEELGKEYEWKNIEFKEATLKDQERIRAALEDEESMPTSSDWAVKLGINLYYSANLSKLPLYNKQMPYNAVIYRAFGCSLVNNSPVKPNPTKRKPGRQRKIVVAGKWCGKVWMSNQVHPYLARQKGEIADKLLSHSSTETNTDTKFKEFEEEAEQKRTVPKKNSSGNKISTARRSGKRKKKPLAREITKKRKSAPQVLEKKMKSSDIVAQIPSTQSGRVLRSCRKLNAKYEADEVIPSNTRSSRKLKAVKGDGRSTEANGGRPSTRVRMQSSKGKEAAKTNRTVIKKQNTKRKVKKEKIDASPEKEEEEKVNEEYTCDIEGCSMSFSTKSDLTLHKKDICPEEGCRKKFFSHKYLLQHRKVHMDDRPLECPWKGCKMKFKWAWARTEHIRVHTGDRPYVCPECEQTFRFVSDFSRHKRKTGHVVKKGKR